MSKIFDKVRIPTAISRRTKLDLDCRHTTTSDFFQFNIPYIRRMIPGEKLDVKVDAFSRLAGMPLPTFGDANLNLRAFFVPYRMIFPAWNEFITDAVHTWSSGDSPSIPTFVPRFRNSDLVSILCANASKVGVYANIENGIPSGTPAYPFDLQNGSTLVTNTFYLFGLKPTDLEISIYDELDVFPTGRLTSDFNLVFDLPSYPNVIIGTYTFDESTGKLTIKGTEQTSNVRYSIQSITFDYTNVQYDFIVNSATPETDTRVGAWKLQPKGRLIYKLFRQLGYSPYFDLGTEVAANCVYHCALDLLAWLKVYLDYYFPAQYYSYPIRANLELLTKNDTPDYILTLTQLSDVVDNCIMVTYASDFVTAAFDTPVGPTDTARSRIYINDPTVTNDVAATNTIYSSPTTDQANAYGTPIIEGNNNSVDGISQFAITALRKLTDYMKRHQLAGARSVDRFLARFGIVLDNNQINRSFYLGSHHVPMVVGDVMATADTISENSGAALGDYAGKGFLIGKDNAHFSFDSGKDYGIFLICSSIVPNTETFQGYDIFTKKFSKLDYFTPEFDGLSTRAIEKGEVCADPTFNISSPQDIRGIFGFTPLYAEYKIPYSRLTGDFNYPSLSEAGFTSDSWHLFRKFIPTNYTSFVHNLNLVLAKDVNQYLRIFYNTDNSADHFVINYLFKVSSSSPVRPLFDTYDFEHEGGKEVDVNVNGKRVN